MEKQKGLSKKEKFICEITWGNIPDDINWIRNSRLFKEKTDEFEAGMYNELYKLENEKTKVL